MKRHPLASLSLYGAALAVAAVSAFPFVWMLSTALKPQPEIFSRVPILLPSEYQWERFAELLSGAFGRSVLNSLLVASATTVGALVLAVFAGYALARFDMSLKRAIVMAVISAQMFPIVVLLVPLFSVYRRLNLLDSLLGLSIAYMVLTLPLSMWLLRGFFLTIPRDLEEAAYVDGATTTTAFLRIVIPLSLPGITATALYCFIVAWNEFLIALTFLSSTEKSTLPVALQAFIGRGFTDWGPMMAGCVLFTVPVIVFFLFSHRRLTEGLASGAVKG